ncbi:proline-rich transmembrane protein 4 [Heteronotia binoei]|uniref:proline-rich transmembrane protein 4 n=1 Tax=Heteronotia binoei TaxID=13085 RepID=UPI00292CEB6C|nr:proline-rich transmembrane protein 4 [Heteronotia binoei]
MSSQSPLRGGPESSSPAASPGSGGAFVALPGCPPDRPEEECASPLPAPGAPGLSSLLVPGLPLPVPLQADWHGARAAWGPAWEAHVYGAGALFALQALLALLGLAALPCRCPPDGRLLAPLQLLLAGAGAARALPLLVLGEEVCGRPGPWPPLAAWLLHELPLPCLTSALALAWLLLLPRRPPAAWLAALLPALHFAAAAGAVLAAQRLPQLAPFLLLAARGLFALLAAPLAAALLARASCCCRCPRRAKGATATCPPRPAARWRRAAALPAALAGLLSAALHGYGLLHALGYGLRAPLLGPWAWWALQLAGRLGEAGVGLPLAAVGLPLPAAPSSSSCRCCAERVAAKAQQSLPRHCPWALAQAPDGKPPPGEEARGPAHHLPLGALRAPSLLDADPTADFRPPSPIDLRRSIDEALCSCEGLFLADAPTGPPSSAASTLSLRLAPAPSDDDGDSPLCRAASCVQLLPSVPTAPASPQPCAASSGSTDASSLALTPSPTRARSPPPPGRQYWARPPASLESLASLGGRQRGGGGGTEAALLQQEFLDVCRQIDALSLASDTIDL